MNCKTLNIEITSFEELRAYQKGLLKMLSKIEVDDLDTTSIEDLK